jgi:hypothetical protein
LGAGEERYDGLLGREQLVAGESAYVVRIRW